MKSINERISNIEKTIFYSLFLFLSFQALKASIVKLANVDSASILYLNLIVFILIAIVALIIYFNLLKKGFQIFESVMDDYVEHLYKNEEKIRTTIQNISIGLKKGLKISLYLAIPVICLIYLYFDSRVNFILGLLAYLFAGWHFFRKNI